MLKEKFDEIIKLIFEKSKEYYKDNLVSFVIYGSCGRGKPTNESDIDLLIILEKAPDGRLKRNLEFYENIEKELENEIKKLKNYGIDTYISPLIKTKEEVLFGSPLFYEMTLGVKVLYDKENFFKTFLKNLKKKIKESGSKKVKGHWIHKDVIDNNIRTPK